MLRLARRADDDGFALVTVLGSMFVLTMILLGALGFAVQNLPRSRADQDSKAAIAAAQAGIEEYVARLNVDDGYWRKGNVDCDNPALIPPSAATCPTPRPATGVPVPGTTGGATYAYRLLTTTAETESDGKIRLAATGWSRGVRRELVGVLNPTGFLQYIYFTDKESLDPALTVNVRAFLNGQASIDDTVNRRETFWRADKSQTDVQCANHWYAGRSAPAYTSGPYLEQVYSYTVSSDGTRLYTLVSTTTKQASETDRITFSCAEIQFTSGDKVAGPLKTNDAMLLSGTPWFTSPTTETGWQNPPDLTKPWREAAGGGTPHAGTSTEAGYKPVIAPTLEMPDSNSALIPVAQSANGCVYRGETRITFNADGTMRVKSPNTDGSVSRCYNGGSNEKVLAVPQVIYVDNTSGSCIRGSVGFPLSSEELDNFADPDYDCAKGNVYISGTIAGRTTIASAHDIIVVGDTTYAGGLTGSDVLGLVPQNNVWIYHPINSNNGGNLLSTPVTKLDAAILSVNRSFLVQNWNRGPLISTSESTKLRVRGSIAQRYRGPVGTANNGYLKDYIYDKRLLNNPPPYFLKPVESPYRVTKVTD